MIGMYVLEHRAPRPTDRRRHRWQAAAICGKAELLQKIWDAQPDADCWRIVMMPGSCEDALRRNAAMAYRKAG